MRKVWLSLLLIFCSSALAFDANGTGVDVNLGEIYDVADSNLSSSSVAGDIVGGEAPTGIWTSGNYHIRLGVYFDQNLPSVSITAPATGSSSTSTSVTLTYTVSAIGNPVRKIFVRLDSESWIDNGLSLSYNFTGLSTAAHTLSVIAMDAYDLNSSTASVTYTVTSAGSGDTGGTGGSTGSSDSGSGGGGGGG
ncbi:MAG TPA: Ig-like domain-containing protein, partial [archaeon]|nr:Ig-like domain-containing protein [archaeon]